MSLQKRTTCSSASPCYRFRRAFVSVRHSRPRYSVFASRTPRRREVLARIARSRSPQSRAQIFASRYQSENGVSCSASQGQGRLMRSSADVVATHNLCKKKHAKSTTGAYLGCQEHCTVLLVTMYVAKRSCEKVLSFLKKKKKRTYLTFSW